MQRINSHLHSKNTPPYVMNLDPAVRNVPFDSNIDIRDSVNYKEVMKQYNLGPNGGIITSLNLFATKIDQILALLEKRTAPDPEKPASKPFKHILVDTPGQIEVFVWSASGAILLDSLASTFPTVIAYIIDTPRTSSTSTFMSNMLYACSILYKTKLPMILVFNKTDVKDAAFAKEWMTDFEAFQAALNVAAAGGSGYMGSLLNSMSLMLEEFYRHLSVVEVSSMTGQGVDGFFDAVKEKAAEYEHDYRPELEKRREERRKEKAGRRERELGKLMRDMHVTGSSKTTGLKTPKLASKMEETGTLSDMEDDEEEEKEGDTSNDDMDDAEDAEVGSNDGLEGRYKQALADEGGAKPGEKNSSFARYLNASDPNK